MLRLHLTHDDLARIRFAPAPLPLLETGFSTRLLQRRDAAARFGRWQDQARRRLAPAVGPLFGLVRPSGYSPEFLDAVNPELDDALQVVAATPTRRVHADLREAYGGRQPPAWVRRLASGDRDARRQVVDALRSYYQTILARDWQGVGAHFDADVAWRTRVLLAGGMEALLGSLHRSIRWHSPVLEIDKPFDRHVDLGGRGLWLMPSVFVWPEPLVAVDPSRQPLVAYPARGTFSLQDGLDGDDAGSGTLAKVLGSTRAAVLYELRRGCSTSEVAQRLQISLASASEHTAVLRQAGLITTRRAGRAVQHCLTELGAGLLDAQPPR
jgi:DNA-binding transcriptional ArsR family regulator